MANQKIPVTQDVLEEIACSCASWVDSTERFSDDDPVTESGGDELSSSADRSSSSSRLMPTRSIIGSDGCIEERERSKRGKNVPYRVRQSLID